MPITKDNQRLKEWVARDLGQSDKMPTRYRQKAIGPNPRLMMHVLYHEVHGIYAYMQEILLDQRQLKH